MQVMAFVAMEPPTALEPRAISEEKNKVFRSMLPIDTAQGGPRPVRRLPRGAGVRAATRTPRRSSRCRSTSTTGAGPVCRSTCAPARRWPRACASSRSPSRRRRGRCSRRTPASAAQGPDHLTFDLADDSRVSLSFYGKRPGPGMRLEKLSMQFSTQETDRAGDVLEAYERLILDAMRGDHTLFTTADGIESLWERSMPLLEDPPPVKFYPPGTLGAQRDPPADRAERLAAAVRAGVAGEEELTRSPPVGCVRVVGDQDAAGRQSAWPPRSAGDCRRGGPELDDATALDRGGARPGTKPAPPGTGSVRMAARGCGSRPPASRSPADAVRGPGRLTSPASSAACRRRPPDSISGRLRRRRAPASPRAAARTLAGWRGRAPGCRRETQRAAPLDVVQPLHRGQLVADTGPAATRARRRRPMSGPAVQRPRAVDPVRRGQDLHLSFAPVWCRVVGYRAVGRRPLGVCGGCADRGRSSGAARTPATRRGSGRPNPTRAAPDGAGRTTSPGC